METNLPLPNKRSGKVRDLYDVALPGGEPGLLIVATDRISAFDVVMANGLPGKGMVLTQISKFWFEHFASESRITCFPRIPPMCRASMPPPRPSWPGA